MIRNFNFKDKIKTKEELVKIIGKLRKLGKSVVWTNGCFDLLHIGHARYLANARNFGDILIVGINSDKSVRALKGPTRPIRPQEDRAELVAALESVDYVVIFEDLRVTNLLSYLQPDIFAKASDYNLDKMDQGERKAVEKYGGKIVFIPIEDNISTSKIIAQIKTE